MNTKKYVIDDSTAQTIFKTIQKHQVPRRECILASQFCPVTHEGLKWLAV